MNREEKIIYALSLVLSGGIIARLIFVYYELGISHITTQQLEVYLSQLIWFAYISTTAMMAWGVTAMTEDKLAEAGKNLPPLTRMQIAILVALLWPILVIIIIVQVIKRP